MSYSDVEDGDWGFEYGDGSDGDFILIFGYGREFMVTIEIVIAMLIMVMTCWMVMMTYGVL